MPSSSETVVTRFAPSPTGFLHIGGARTALFNWLFARHHGGRFALRIEDTDRKRSTQEAIDAIIDGLRWLGLTWDGDIVHQSERAERHAQMAQVLLDQGKAYRCFCSPQELEQMRAAARAEGRPMLYDGRWRERAPEEAPAGIDPAIRLKMPREGETVIEDAVQGAVTVSNGQLDDMVLLRADGTPTYMLSVVVDDHDMGITHVVRGDDHLTNAFRQLQLFRALGWPPPVFAHIPLIHGPDGAKLSKRHGALGIEAYRDELGYLPEALRNYLLRLGWSHGDDEIIATAQAIEWFDLDGIGRSPARFDFAKLDSLNAHYLRQSDDAAVTGLLLPRLEAKLGRPVGRTGQERLLRGMTSLKDRAKTLAQLSDMAMFYVTERPLALDGKARKVLDQEARSLLSGLQAELSELDVWDETTLENCVRQFAAAEDMKLGQIAQPLRAALTGSSASPSLFEVMTILGREESLARIGDQIAEPAAASS